jgi:hypothetical protein
MLAVACISLIIAASAMPFDQKDVVPLEFEPADFNEFLVRTFNKTHDEMFAAAPNGFVYTYHQRSGQFSGPGFDGSYINVVGCSGETSCGGRNNPSKQCVKNCGPLPEGSYAISAEQVYHGMPHCYVLSQTSGDSCGRGGFLIHGGSCSADPSTGCIVIQDPNVRYKIKGGGSVNVYA